jgi:hypothetical protein
MTAPTPGGWGPNTAAGEPAYCWSKISPFAGTYAVSIYQNWAGDSGRWLSTLTFSGLLTLAGAARFPSGAGAASFFTYDGSFHTTTSIAAGAAWAAYPGFPGFLAVANIYLQLGGVGLVYFDNVAVYQGTPVVAQPTILRVSGRSVAKFGSAALPNGQGVMPQIDLNDYVNTLLDWLDNGKQIGLDEANRQIGLEQFLYLAHSTYVSDDFGPRPISIPITYIEDATHFLGGFLAAIEQAGEQQLTFDNLTYIAVKHAGIASRVTSRSRQPLAWDFVLNLIAAEPWFKDLAASALLPLTLTVDAGQAFVIPYQGTVRCIDEVWTLIVPASNGVAINSMVLSNLMTGEALTINFQSYLAIPATTARVITIDCGASTVVDDLGHPYDYSGTFPKLYPAMRHPAVDQFNPFQVVMTPASGATAGLTLACAYTPRWQI